MEQTVTTIEGNGHSYELFDSELPRVQAHLDHMTGEGWVLVSTLLGDRTNTPIMMFWRRG